MTTREQNRARAVARCRERGVVIPTLDELRDPTMIHPDVVAALRPIDPEETDPLNLFRISWRNDPASGGFGDVTTLELPSALTGVPCRIVGLVGKHFPTGAHKVGAAFGCLVPRLVRGDFDPTRHSAVWPSTGNYCRGGVFDSALLGCRSVAILPEGMSRERFAWLERMGTEIIATPGSESNVKEIFDACWDIRKTRPDAVIFNQFEEFGNYVWHYAVTGPAAESAFRRLARPNDRLTGWVAATGSAGTLAAGDYLKQTLGTCTITAAEALQCPTLLHAGFGAHRIEGIGDKHVPWIHNVRSTDFVTAIDDEAAMRIFRLFNDPAGHDLLVHRGIAVNTVGALPLLGISCIANVLAAIKTARYYELNEHDVLLTSFTDSAEMYLSRLAELEDTHGRYSLSAAGVDFERYLLGTTTDHVRELRYTDRKALHNLKYFTWVEQQGKSAEELDALWSPSFWDDLVQQIPEWNREIQAFNEDSGVVIGAGVGMNHTQRRAER